MFDLTFGLRFLLSLDNDEMERTIKYLESQQLEYKVVKQDIEELTDDPIGDMYIIWYKGSLADQRAIMKASNGVEFKM